MLVINYLNSLVKRETFESFLFFPRKSRKYFRIPTKLCPSEQLKDLFVLNISKPVFNLSNMVKTMQLSLKRNTPYHDQEKLNSVYP